MIHFAAGFKPLKERKKEIGFTGVPKKLVLAPNLTHPSVTSNHLHICMVRLSDIVVCVGVRACALCVYVHTGERLLFFPLDLFYQFPFPLTSYQSKLHMYERILENK